MSFENALMSFARCPFATCAYPFSRCCYAPELYLRQEKPSQKASPRNSSLKRREAERREAHHRAASKSDAARVRSPVFPIKRKDRGRRLMERARSPFGAPPRHSPRFYPRLGSGRASWNHRMQTGGPSPAPVQRAPRGPAPAGRDDAQAARERSVSLRPTRTAPAPPSGVPSRKASFASGILAR